MHRVLVLLLEALAQLPGVTGGELVVFHQCFDVFADAIECGVLGHVARDHDRGQPIEPLDGARSLGDAEIGHRGEWHARAAGQVDGKLGQVVDALPVGFAECESQSEFAFGTAELAQPIAAHSRGHGLRHVGGSEAEGSGALAVHDDLNLVITLARLGAHGFQAFHGRHTRVRPRRLSAASFSVDSPVSCRLKRSPPMPPPSSQRKLALPMTISGRPSCAFAMNSCATMPPSSRGFSTTIEKASVWS